MAFAQTSQTIASAVTLTAGAADVTLPASSYVNTEYAVGAVLDITVTNGATGPTLPADIGIQINDDPNDSDAWITVGSLLVSATGNNTVTRFKLDIPPSFQNIRLLCGGNTGQNVTLSATLTKVTNFS